MTWKKTFGDVSDDDADEEDDGIEPLVAQGQGDDEEGDAQEDGHSGDEVNEMGNFTSDGRFIGLQTRSQSSDASHHRVVTDADDNGTGRTCSFITFY